MGEELEGSAEREGPPTEEILEDARDEALDFLEGLLDAMDLDGDVDADLTPEGLNVRIEGEDSGILIGRHGHTLEAVQDLLRTTVQRQVRTRLRINLDIEGYRARRSEAVQAKAREMADVALREGEVELEPMSAYERKVVHDTVAEISGVTSFSEGEEPNRRVILRAE